MSVTYDILFAPPPISVPTGLTLTSTSGGRLDIDLVQPTQVTLRFSFVQISKVSGDYTNAILVAIPQYRTHAALEGMPGGVTLYARAWGADAWGNVSDFTAEASVATAAGSGSLAGWVPVMDGLGNVLTDSGTGAAIMAYVVF